VSEILEILVPEVLVISDTEMEIIEVAIQGPPGRDGTGAAATYIHTQAIAASVWTVAHNRGRRPAVMVVDNLSRALAADVAYLDDNTLQITHGAPMTGAVYCI
jgi:hypothetical protein